MSRNLIVSLLLLSMLGACSSNRVGGIGPHRIDVQQGNALDQESVAKLKPGLSRSQVRFLLGTPLLVDPFHTNRWDYVYMFHKAGKLTEQKRITLFFDNDTLQRIEGDVPVGVAESTPVAELDSVAPVVSPTPASTSAAESTPLDIAKKPEPVVITPIAPQASAPAAASAPLVQSAPVSAATSATPTTGSTAAQARVTSPQATSASTATATSIVAPLANSAVPASPAAQHSGTDLQLNPETNVAQIQPNVMPPFPEPNTPPPASATQASVLNALKAWSDAWEQGNADAYIAAYAGDYSPPGGDNTHAAWEKRRRSLLGIAKNVALRIDAPKVKMMADGHALVTFKQYYRSTNARDDLVKEIKFAQRDGRWVIVEERVVSTLQAPKL